MQRVSRGPEGRYGIHHSICAQYISMRTKLTAWNWSCLDRLIVIQLGKNCPYFKGPETSFSRVHKNPPLVPTMSQINPMHAKNQSYFLNIHFNIILQSTLRSSNGSVRVDVKKNSCWLVSYRGVNTSLWQKGGVILISPTPRSLGLDGTVPYTAPSAPHTRPTQRLTGPQPVY